MQLEVLLLLLLTHCVRGASKSVSLERFYLAERPKTVFRCTDKPPVVILPVIIKLLRFPKVEKTYYKISSGYFTTMFALFVRGKLVSGSIVGETYRDELDFRSRYRNVHECDPFYWHPLHMPEECADMYEQLIRSQLSGRPHMRSREDSDEGAEPYVNYVYEYQELPNDYPTVYQAPQQFPIVQDIPREMTPYEEMLESVRKDVKYLPSYPSVRVVPNLGPVVVYRQPISSQSVMLIKTVSKTYSNAAREAPVYNMNTPDAETKENNWKRLVDKAIAKGWKKSKKKGPAVTLKRN